jgi:hypothetical protein
MTKVSTWKRKESRQSRPFDDYSNALRDTAFSHLGPNDLTTNTAFLVEEDFEVLPVLAINVRRELLPEQVRSSENLEIMVILRFPSVRYSIQVGSWRLNRIPEMVNIPFEHFDGKPNDFEVSVFLVAKNEIECGSSCIPAYSRLGSKDFKVKTDSTDNDFDIKFVEPSAFEDRGYSGSTLWLVECVDEDFNQPPSACFEVLINKRVDGKLQGIAAANVTGKIAMQLISLEIEYDISRQVLSKGGIPESEAGILAVLSEKLCESLGVDHQHLLKLARDEPGKIRSAIQSSCRITRLIENADVRRRRQ